MQRPLFADGTLPVSCVSQVIHLALDLAERAGDEPAAGDRRPGMKDMPMKGGAMADVQLNTRGLNCPLPILRLKKTLNGMTTGQVLEMEATDPGAVRDVEAFCRQTRHVLLSASESGGVYYFQVQKS